MTSMTPRQISASVLICQLLPEKKYDNHLATAAAAYHNGVGAVDTLLAEAQYSSDGITLDRYPYPQMRQYVRKITENQRYHRTIPACYSEIYALLRRKERSR